MLFDFLSGTGATEFINNNGGEAGGYAWYERANTGAGAGSPTATLSAAGVYTPVGGVNPGNSKLLSKITVSNSAPGVLANGELYLRY